MKEMIKINKIKIWKFFFKEYIGEPILNHFITHPDMKTKESAEILDLRHQLDHTTPKYYQLFQEYGTDPDCLE